MLIRTRIANLMALGTLTALTALVGVASLGASSAAADPLNLFGASGHYSFDTSNCQEDSKVDPVGILFRGKKAYAANVNRHLQLHTRWKQGGADDQYVWVNTQSGPECRRTNVHNAQYVEGPWDRNHARLWFVPASGPSEYMTVATPHYDEWVIGHGCEDIPKPGSHSVPERMDLPGGGEGSGFDYTRTLYKIRLEDRSDHLVKSEYWGNTRRAHQCDGDESASNGEGVTVWINNSLKPELLAATSSATTATLRGSLGTEEAKTEWWFAYGPNPARGVSGYPFKTAVKSVSGATEFNTTEAISGLSPNTTYYVRMFARNQDGEIEEGNEVQYSTCGPAPKVDQFDSLPGPSVVAQCSGTVDVFYRDSSGNLGHHWWTPSDGWATETRGASIAPSAVPRVVAQPSNNGNVDIFYRDSSGNLGHHWWNPFNGWASETHPASMASNPVVTAQPNGVVDVFYRDTNGDLGHHWWNPSSGWASETRDVSITPGTEPHVTVQSNGVVDVFWRDVSGKLDHHWWAPGNGWFTELRDASIAPGAEPHVTAQSNGVVDVFFRDVNNDIGHHWWTPGSGWSSETRDAWLTSDPYVTAQSNGVVDVFFRDVNGDLGHHWWIPTVGWSSETHDVSMASAPRVIAHANGVVDVFFRDTNGDLGHKWWNPSTGWAGETRDTSMASAPRVAAQSNGVVDVFWRDVSGKLDHHWWAPANGWFTELRDAAIAARPPAATATAATEVSDDAANLNATINPEGSPTSYYFEYGPTTSYGSKAPLSPQAVGFGAAPLDVSRRITGLSADTTYHYRVVASGPEGTTTSGDKTLKTPNTVANLATMTVSEPFDGSSASTANFFANWGLLGWAANKGQDTTAGWGPTAAYPELQGAFSNITAYDAGYGVGAVATLTAGPAANGEHFSLWIDTGSPTSSSRGGYELRFVRAAAGSYNVTLSKWSGGTQAVLATKTAYALPTGSPIAVTDVGSSVSGWANLGSGFVKILSATDSAASGGKSSISASGAAIRLAAFKTGRLVPSTALEAGTTTEWRPRNSNSAGSPSFSFLFGGPGRWELVGDWNGDGVETPANYDPASGIWRIRNSFGAGPADVVLQFGGGYWNTPIVGDWNGDGIDTIGVFAAGDGNWAMRNSNVEGPATISFQYGGTEARPVAGNWDGIGADGIGVYYPVPGVWDQRECVCGGPPTRSFQYGGSQFRPVVGDWDGNGTDTVGLYETSPGNWALRNSNSSGTPNVSFQYGGGIWVKGIVGDWDGNGVDTIGVVND